jgi:hypothetical protein
MLKKVLQLALGALTVSEFRLDHLSHHLGLPDGRPVWRNSETLLQVKVRWGVALQAGLEPGEIERPWPARETQSPFHHCSSRRSGCRCCRCRRGLAAVEGVGCGYGRRGSAPDVVNAGPPHLTRLKPVLVCFVVVVVVIVVIVVVAVK